MYVGACVRSFKDVNTNYLHTYIHTYIHAYIHTYIYAYIHYDIYTRLRNQCMENIHALRKVFMRYVARRSGRKLFAVASNRTNLNWKDNGIIFWVCTVFLSAYFGQTRMT